MHNHLQYIFTIGALFFFMVTSPCASGSDELLPGAAHEAGATAIAATPEQEQIASLKVPLLSPQFASTPVALVNDEPVTLGELVYALGPRGESDTGLEGEKLSDYQGVLQRIIDSRLIVQEAENIGLNERHGIQTEIKDYKLKTLFQELINNHLEGLEPDPADVQALYQKMSREVQLYTLAFELGPDAQLFLGEVKEGDFDELAKHYTEEGKAKGTREEQYVKIKDLLSSIGEQVYSMDVGSISNVFRTGEGFLLFQLTDSRFVEDEAVKKEAYKIIFDSFRKQKAMEYSNALTEKYITFDEALYDQLDFNEDFEQLKKDKRVLATVKGDEPVTITVADLAAKVDVSFFHGTDKAQHLKLLDKKKDIAITNMLFKITGELEARRLGLDRTDEFVKKVRDFEHSILFREFMNKVVLPDVKLTPEEVRSYYDEHIDEYSSPAMLRMNSLVFSNQQDAERAFDKLQKGADFKWVSANSAGFVPPDTEGLLPFDEKLLSLTSLPEDLQETARGTKKGDSLLYAAPEGGYFYVLYIEDVFLPEPQPYDQARPAVSRTVFDMKGKQLLAEWVAKLKEVYETRVFITNLEQ